MKCKKCGEELKKTKSGYTCPGCGKKYGSKKAKQRRKKKKMLMTGVIAAIIVAVLITAVLLITKLKRDNAVTEAAEIAAVETTEMPTPRPTATPEPTAEPIPAASANIRAVGDVMSHKLQLRHALQEDGSFNYDSQFEYVRASLVKADLTIANLECSIGEKGGYSSYPRFKTPAALLDTLKDCGVDLLTMANNHILDGFADGLFRSVNEVEARGFDFVGVGRTKEEANKLTIVDVNGIKFGVLAYTYGTNDNEKSADSKPARGCIRYLSTADFDADVQALRDAGAEMVICLPHWGDESTRAITGDMKKYAKKMVDAGVDIILGSHPHMVFPIQLGTVTDANGKEKQVLIAWSMGNFISYMANKYVDSGIIVDFTVKRSEAGEYSIENVGYVPVYVWGNPNVFHLLCSMEYYEEKPNGMSDDDFKRMRQSVKEIQEMCGSDFEMLAN